MLYTFELYEGKHFVGTKTVEAASELQATVDLDCELEEEGRSHLEYELLEEEPMQALDESLGSEARQAMDAFYRMQESQGTWQERQRQADYERLAYCGWEEF